MRQGTAKPNKSQSQTAPAHHCAEAPVLLAGLMPVFLQGAALYHTNMPAGYPWHGAALSSMDKCKFHFGAAGCFVVGFFFQVLLDAEHTSAASLVKIR